MDIISILRQYKVGPFAVFDTIISYIGLFLLAPILTKIFRGMHLEIPRASWLWFVLPISVVFHFFFSQQTPLMKLLASSNGYIAIIILFVMTYLGVRVIRVVR